MRDHPRGVLVGRSPAQAIEVVGARGRPVRCGHDPETLVSAMPGRVETLERRHHVLDRPRVAHRRAANLVGEVVGEPFEEPLVRFVDVEVLVTAHEAERGPHPHILVGLERRRAPEVRHPRPPVVHVDRRGLPALQRVDQPPEDPRVEVLLLDVARRCLDEDVRALEDELIQTRTDGELGVVVAVHEPGHHEVRSRSEDGIERTSTLELGSRPGRDDRRALHDQGSVFDQRSITERDDRVTENQRSPYDGTTIRSRTCWNARFAS